MPRIRYFVLTLVIILTVVGITPSHAQTAPTQTGTTPDGKLAFDYPADWATNTLDNETFVTYLANTEATFTGILAGEPIQTGQIVVVVYSPELYAQELGESGALTALDAAGLLYPIPNPNADFTYVEPTAYFIGGRPAARVDYGGTDSQGTAFFVELSDGTVGTIIGVALPGELDPFLPDLFAVAQSLRPGDGVAVVDTPPATDTPPTTDVPAAVTSERFVNQAGNLSFDYPAAWDAAETADGISIAGTAEMRQRIVDDPASIQSNDFLVNVVGPTPLSEILATASSATLEGAATQFMDQIASQFDATIAGPDTLTLGGKPALRYVLVDDSIDYLSIFLEMGNDEIVVVTAFGLKGELIQYEEQILAIATSMQVGGSSMALTPYTTANGKFEIGLPVGWLVQEVAGYVVTANSESAVNHLIANASLAPGEAGIIIYTTPLLELVLPVPTNSLPVQALNGFIRAYQRPDVTYGAVQNPDALTAFVTISGSSGDGALYVVNTHGYENTIFVGLGATGEFFQYETVLRDVIASFVALGEE